MSAHPLLTSVEPFLAVAEKFLLMNIIMIPFKERLSIKVRMPDKLVKFGFKFFVLCDAKSGYLQECYHSCWRKDDRAAGNLGKI